MAVGVIIGGAFNAIVTAFTNQIIMPLINWLLSVISGGQNGLESAITILKPAYDDAGNLLLANSIYINWGSFISAILNFLIIAMTLFIILKVAMKSSALFKDARTAMKPKLTRAERKSLKAEGKNPHDAEVIAAFLEEKAQKAEEARLAEEANAKILADEKYKNSTEYLLKEILATLKEKEEPKKTAITATKKTIKQSTKKQTK